jgi:hypothetical protein
MFLCVRGRLPQARLRRDSYGPGPREVSGRFDVMRRKKEVRVWESVVHLINGGMVAFLMKGGIIEFHLRWLTIGGHDLAPKTPYPEST